MIRHNETQKKKLRLKSQQQKEDNQTRKGESERADMEQSANSKMSVHFQFIFKDPGVYSSFTVFLRKRKLSDQEITERLQKAFGDL